VTDTSRLHILHVVCTDAFAGVERHIAALAADQASRGHDVEVIGGHPAIITATINDPSVRHQPARTVPQALLALQRTAPPSVINAHMTSAELAAICSPRMWGVPVVSTRHFAQPRGSRRLSRPVVRAAARRISAQISVSRYVADHIDGPSTVIHSGVTTRAGVTLPAVREPVVLMAQRLEPEKATDVGIEAFAASGLRSRGWRLQIAGDGHLRHRLHRLAAERGVGDAVDFLGHREDVDTLMCSASILLAPRPDEGYGLTVLEAMATGLPVVAAAGGGHLETAGCLPDAALFPPGNVADAAQLLDRLADDPASRHSYGVALQTLQRRQFTVAAQSAATEAVYRSVL
jgi:glycosyltransferase involved in cell wall biosynthesis